METIKFEYKTQGVKYTAEIVNNSYVGTYNIPMEHYDCPQKAAILQVKSVLNQCADFFLNEINDNDNCGSWSNLQVIASHNALNSVLGNELTLKYFADDANGYISPVTIVIAVGSTVLTADTLSHIALIATLHLREQYGFQYSV